MKEAYGRFLVEMFVHQDEIKIIDDEPLRERLRNVWQSYSEAISTAANMTTLIAFSPAGHGNRLQHISVSSMKFGPAAHCRITTETCA